MTELAASPIVNLTLWLLIAFSIVTWALIFLKAYEHWQLGRSNAAFLAAFWSARDLKSAEGLQSLQGPLSRIAHAGFGALNATQGQVASLATGGDTRDILERTFRQTIQQERHQLERGLTVLASIGSTAPFVGLFGTVWGIMHALKDISLRGSASLDVVAGPIGEALIATAIGIAAAIPAVLAYNALLRRIKLAEADLENFATDFLHLAIRTGFSMKTGD